MNNALPIKNITRVVVFIFITCSFAFLGWIFLRNTNFAKLNINEKEGETNLTTVEDENTYKGIIKYYGPNQYNKESITHVLVDQNNKEIILLTAKDDKLLVVEGQSVQVQGDKVYTKDKLKQVLIVKKVIVGN